MDIATFFGICVWLVPFYLFLSLSANDNVLPSAGTSFHFISCFLSFFLLAIFLSNHIARLYDLIDFISVFFLS